MRPLLACLLLASAVLWAGGVPPTPAAPPVAAFPADSYVGTWEGTDAKGITAAFDLEEDGYAILHMKGQVLGGQGADGRSLRYEVDVTRTPVWLDFIASDGDGNELGRLRAILERQGPDRMRMMINDNPTVRPAGFQAATPDSCITLHRRP